MNIFNYNYKLFWPDYMVVDNIFWIIPEWNDTYLYFIINEEIYSFILLHEYKNLSYKKLSN